MNNPANVFIYYLNQLEKILYKIERHCAGCADILSARLHADMLPFANQVRATANFALRGCCPLVGRVPVSFEVNESSFQSLVQQIQNTVRYLQEISSLDVFNAVEPADKAGFATVKLPAEQFIQLYIFPNFYFHLSMVYAIARNRGISLSKQDFDGLHQYPENFSFELAGDVT